MENTKTEAVNKILADLEKDQKLANGKDFKKDMDFLKTLVYVLSGVVAFLVFILLTAVVYVYMYTQSLKKRPHHPRRRLRRQRRRNDARQRGPRPVHHPRARPRPRNS